MIPARHFDHTVTIWRATEAAGATFRDIGRSWAKVSGEDGVGMAVQAKRETRQDAGPGERVVGEYRGFAPAGMDVVEGDVVQVTAGPESPRNLKADSVYRPRNRHTQLVLVEWQGALP